MGVTAQVRDGAEVFLPAQASSTRNHPRAALRLTHMLILLLYCLFDHSSLPPLISSSTIPYHPPHISSTTRLKAVTMHLKSYFLALIGVSLVTASFTECGSSDPTESQLQIARKLHAIEKNMTRLEDDITKIDIDVYVHCSHFAYLWTDITLG
jgi:hypothetical protein